MDCLPQLHLAAIHAEPGYRSAVPGLGVLCTKGTWSLGAGRYSNSLGRPSNYLAFGYQPWRIGSVRLGGMAGVVDGYEHNNGAAMPMGAAFVSMPQRWGGVHLVVFPQIQGITPWTLQLSVTLRWGSAPNTTTPTATPAATPADTH